MNTLKTILIVCISILLINATHLPKEQYKCIPCGHECDKIIHDKPGKCSACNMELVKASSIVFKTTEPENICSYIKSHPQSILLDVRTKEEFEGKADPDFGTLKNAINIPIDQLKSKLSTIEKYKNTEIIVFCSHSHRSPQASYTLTQNGFKKVVNMNGGMSVVTDATCKK